MTDIILAASAENITATIVLGAVFLGFIVFQIVLVICFNKKD